MMATFSVRTRDRSGRSGQAREYSAKCVPSWRPGFRGVGTGSRDTFESINTGLSRLSRLVPTDMGEDQE
jgi:hypothetical protein